MSTTVTQLTGRVKWFNPKTGYGFITVVGADDQSLLNKDVFAHYSSINTESSQYKYLVQGEYVSFSLTPSNSEKHEYNSVNISGILGGPLMCQTHQQNGTRSTGPYAPRQASSSVAVDASFTEVRRRSSRPQTARSQQVQQQA